MKKVIIGLRVEYLSMALGASIVSLLGIFLPFVSTSSDKLSLIRVMGSSKFVQQQSYLQ